MLLIRNAEIFAPRALGRKDVLIEGDKISAIADQIELNASESLVRVLDLQGKRLIPGLIDQHVHVTGGGGEQGPASRTPESTLSAFILNGVTTVLGLLGTDGISRSLENLYAKVQALNAEGITAFMLTGSYAMPSPTLSGSVERDLYLIEPCIGVKIAVSDHRGSHPTVQELIRLATEARRGGLISGKAGIMTIHMGKGKARLKPILDAIQESDLPIKCFVPTHVNARSPELLDDCLEFTAAGGVIDFTARQDDEGHHEDVRKIRDLIARGMDPANLTVSSDAFGSQPRFDAKGNCIGLTYSTSSGLGRLIQILVEDGFTLEEAIPFFTENPARVLGLSGRKGEITVGADADLAILEADASISGVIARGKIAMLDRTLLMRGSFEE